MAVELYNTLTRSREPFTPLEEGVVRVYACGPTIYNHAHIGNFRSFVAFDLVHRYLKWLGYDVRFVMNLTDVDDNTIDAAAEAGTDIRDYTEPYGEAFLEESRALGILPATSYPRATEYVGPMIELVERLEEKGHAYASDDGSVYYSIESFPDYGKLSRMDPDQMRAGARVAQDDFEKRDERDFVLWKKAKEKDERVGAAWDSPWGRGRPGWHLECSVMSMSELGDTLDLHLGGEDLVFPHHEGEIAQSEGATGKPFVRTWLHVKHLMVEGRKMSKSLGNFIRVKELLDEGHDPAAVRHQLLGAHYRSKLNFTREGLAASAKAVQRLLDFEDRLEAIEGRAEEVDDADVADGAVGAAGDGASGGKGGPGSRGVLESIAREALDDFRAAMDDDLNSANAMAALFTFVSRANAALDEAGDDVSAAGRDALLDTLHSMDEVLGFIEVAHRSRSVDEDTADWAERKIQEREEARAARDFERADAIRDELEEQGIVLEDTAEGTRWKVASGSA